jgi:essential nuclear protein 1
MPKATTPTSGRQRRHNPLENDIIATGNLSTKPPKRKSKEESDEEHYIDSKASKNILRIGRELIEEDQAENASSKPTVDSFGYDSRFGDEAEFDEQNYDDDEAWGDEDEVVEEIEIDPDDLATYRKFLPEEEDDLLKHGWDRNPDGDQEEEGQGVNLADLILEKIAEKEAAQARREQLAPPDDDYELPPKVVEVYTK